MLIDKNLAEIYPELIRTLPEADIPFKGVTGWISQGKNHQIVFMDIEPIGKVDKHKHATQWGIVVDGEMELTIGNETKLYQKGDYYYIPEGILHSAVFTKQTRVIDFFAEEERYKIRTKKTKEV
jgi:quercetin dioxygenase-like cupin family protein